MEREERPAHGTAQGGPSLLSDKETALYKHVKFFDRDGDGKVGPLDTYRGFRDIGFGILLSLYAAIVIPLAMGWLTNDKYLTYLHLSQRLCVVSCDLTVCACACAKVEDHNGNFRAHEFDQLFDSFDLDGDGKLSFLELTGSGGRRSSSSGAFCSSCAKRTGRSAGRACAASTTVRCSTPSPRGEERRQSSLCRGRCRRRSSRRSGGRRNDEHEE